MNQIYMDLRTYYRNSNIQEIEKIQEQLVVQLKSKKVDSEVLDVDEFARIDIIDRVDDHIAKRTQSNHGLEAESSHAVITAKQVNIHIWVFIVVANGESLNSVSEGGKKYFHTLISESVSDSG